MKLRFFDFEVFPNWWCCVFGDEPVDWATFSENDKTDFVVIHSKQQNARDRLLEMFRGDRAMVGYNIKRYDLAIANGIYQGFSPQQLRILSDIIINPSLAYKTKEHLMLSSFVKKKLSGCSYQDLMDDGAGSLKDKESVLGLSIMESSVPFDKEDLTDEDLEDVIFYCKQDVYASMIFYREVVKPYTKAKLALARLYNIPEETCHKSTNASLVSMALKGKRLTYTDSEEIVITMPKKIEKYCRENVPEDILNRLLTSQDPFEVKLFGNTVSYGNGGIHSVLRNELYVESDEEYALVNVDATSYYPSMLIQFGCLTRSVGTPELFKNIYDERVRIKHLATKTVEEEENQLAYKLVLNTTFGASGNKYVNLYDPYQCTRCCRLGQIFLTGLACKMYKQVPSISIVQTNTDGILIYCKRTELPIVQRLMDEWTEVSGIGMDMDEASKMWQKNVNNYIMIETNGKLKRRGQWLQEGYYRPGYVTTGSLNAYVCAIAARKFLTEGVDIVDTILSNKNVTDFMMSCTKGSTFSGVVQRYTNGMEVPLTRCNRVYASKDGSLGKLYKLKMYKGQMSYHQMPDIPDHCRTLNEDLSHIKFEDIKKDLDYMYYVERTADLLNVDWYQLVEDKLIKINSFDYE